MNRSVSRIAVGFLAAGFAGCVVVDAPEDLESLMVFGFEHFESDDAYMEEMVDALRPLIVEQEGDLTEGYRIGTLDAEQLQGAGVPDGDPAELQGALGQADYVHDFEEVLLAVTLPDKAEHFDNFTSYTLLESSDLECFLAGTCRDYSVQAEQTFDAGLLGASRQILHQDIRRYTMTDGTPFVVSRILSPEGIEFDTNIVEIDQNYQLYVLYPTPEGTRRVEAFWIESRVIGLDVPDSMAVNHFARAVTQQAEQIDDWLDAQ